LLNLRRTKYVSIKITYHFTKTQDNSNFIKIQNTSLKMYSVRIISRTSLYWLQH